MKKNRWAMVDSNGEVRFKAEGDEIECGEWYKNNREHFEKHYPGLKLQKETFEYEKPLSVMERLEELERRAGIKAVQAKPGLLARMFRRRPKSAESELA